MLLLLHAIIAYFLEHLHQTLYGIFLDIIFTLPPIVWCLNLILVGHDSRVITPIQQQGLESEGFGAAKVTRQ